MNQTLLGMMRLMLNLKGFCLSYWAEEVHIALYLRNTYPTTYLDGITPYEAWSVFKERIKHLGLFGSTCYALVPKGKRTKLDS